MISEFLLIFLLFLEQKDNYFLTFHSLTFQLNLSVLALILVFLFHEKEILKLKQEQTDLVEKLKNEKLENNYLSAPERVKKLAKIHLSQDYIEMDK